MTTSKCFILLRNPGPAAFHAGLPAAVRELLRLGGGCPHLLQGQEHPGIQKVAISTYFCGGIAFFVDALRLGVVVA